MNNDVITVNNDNNILLRGDANRLIVSNTGLPVQISGGHQGVLLAPTGTVEPDVGLPDDALPPVVRVLFTMKAELERARGKHGPQDYSNWKWSNVLMEEVGEAAQEINDHEDNTSTATPADRRAYLERLYKEVIQCGAMSLGWAEKLQGRIRAIS